MGFLEKKLQNTEPTDLERQEFFINTEFIDYQQN